MKRILESIGVGIIVGLTLKAVEKYGGINILKSIYHTFIVELWPMWIGLLAAALYWLVADYIKLRRSHNDLIKWIGYFKWPHAYNDLKGKIYHYIRDELGKRQAQKTKKGKR